jgi:hypothetical protein
VAPDWFFHAFFAVTAAVVALGFLWFMLRGAK